MCSARYRQRVEECRVRVLKESGECLKCEVLSESGQSVQVRYCKRLDRG